MVLSREVTCLAYNKLITTVAFRVKRREKRREAERDQ